MLFFTLVLVFAYGVALAHSFSQAHAIIHDLTLEQVKFGVRRAR